MRPVIKRFGKEKPKKLGECNAHKVLYCGVSALRKVTPCWLSAGTLLGIYRDGELMPDDHDIDVGAICFPDYREADIIKSMTTEGFSLWRRMTYNGRPMQLVFLHDDERCLFDIYFFERQGYEIVNYNYLGVLRKPIDLFEPLGVYEKFGRTAYPVPNDIERYLEIRYGKDWRQKKGGSPDWGDYAANLTRWTERM